MDVARKFCWIFLLLFGYSYSYSQTWNDANNQGLDAYKKGDYDIAISYYEKAKKLAKNEFGEMHNNYATCLNNLGMVYKVTANYEKAEAFFKEALGIREKAIGKNSKDYSISLNNLASLYKVMGKYELAEPLYIEAAEIGKQMYGENDPVYAAYLNNLGALNKLMGKYKEAEGYYLQSALIIKTANGEMNAEYASAINNLAILYKAMGNFIEAEPLYLKSLEIRRKLLGETNPDFAASLNNIGLFYEDLGNYQQAELYYHQAIEVIQNSLGKVSLEYATSIQNLALFYSKIGDYAEAESLMLEALKIRQDLLGEASPDYAASLNALGMLYYNLYNYNKSVGYLNQALALRKKIFGESHPSYAVTLNNTAMVYREMGELDKAEALYLQAIQITEQLVGKSNNDYATGLNNLAELYSRMGDYGKAEGLFLNALDIRTKLFGEQSMEVAITLNNLAVLAANTGDYNKAEQYILASLETRENVFGKENNLYQESVSNLISLYMRMGSYDKIIQYVGPSVHNFQMNILQLSSFLSEAEMQNDLSAEAPEFDAFHSLIWSEFNKLPELRTLLFDFDLFLDGIQLRSATSLKRTILNSADTSLIAEYADWMSYRSQISKQMSLPVKIRSMETEKWQLKANNLEKSLRKNSTKFNADRQDLNINLRTIQSRLEIAEAAIEFISFRYCNGSFWTDSILYYANIFMKNDTVPIFVPLFEQQQLKGLFTGDSLRTFANLLYTSAQIRSVDHDISYGDSLYKLIWKPLEPYLTGVNKVYYAPAGLLHNIAFDAIPVKEEKVLSDQYYLSRLTTTGRILERDSGYFMPSSIALFGGINYDTDTTELKHMALNYRIVEEDQYSQLTPQSLLDSESRGGGWTYLIGTEKEVHSIESLFKKREIPTNMYASQFGTEEAFKGLDSKNSPSILHFSTHGFFFPDPEIKRTSLNLGNADNTKVFSQSNNPLLRSGLIMSGANYVWKGGSPIAGLEDGILTADEVSNMYLPNTKLVVLSACETGLGDIKGSEGVYGLQRAFKMAGVEYIMMTLWQVLDKETSDFMTLFYQNLLLQRSIPDAFKTTQDAMKNKYREEPYKWAGFVLIK